MIHEASGPGQRVLIVDDEVTIRIALRRFFGRLGWTVEEAADGLAAYHVLASDQVQDRVPPFDVIISDLRMPGLSGIELYERLQAQFPEATRRLIFTTGDLVSQEAALFVQSVECEVLQKPFELAALREMVERVVASNAR